MADRFKYTETRQTIIDMLRNDLMGPLAEDEVLNERPQAAYVVGMLGPCTPSDNLVSANEQEIDSDIAYGDDADYTAGQDDDNEPVSVTKFKVPSSIGISFYLDSSTPVVNIDVSWGDYVTRSGRKKTDKNGNETTLPAYARIPMKATVAVNLGAFNRKKEYPLECDTNVCLHVSKIPLKEGYSLVSVYVINRRSNSADSVESLMFQVNIKAYSPDNADIFIAEHKCREILAPDEYYFRQRPVFGRGRGCAAAWGPATGEKTSYVKSDFIPQYEIPGVSAALPGFDPLYFSMRFMSVPGNKNETMSKLNTLADTYENWINGTLMTYPELADEKFREGIGKNVIGKCRDALTRIREGIMLLGNDDAAFDAFCFMNRTMILQRNIMNYAKKHGSNPNCSFRDFTDPRVPENDFGWYPFQIAFILMNLNAIVDPLHSDREVVDLLYFPTGGGKTEAYLGLMAFVIANRRLRRNSNDELIRDGGVTVILRYTLRLLTTQQRDRITKMIIAAEMIRKKEASHGSFKYGREPISIGFWVGGGVTPNKFSSLKRDPANPNADREAVRNINLIHRQFPTCPFCGAKLTENEFRIDIESKTVSIFCPDKTCMFFIFRDPKNENKIPVYLVDEEIYAKCPTVILSTVDKFAVLPWEPKTATLFGKVKSLSERDGYVAAGDDEHPSRHNKTKTLRAAAVKDVKPFLPPELIIQDELHLITGPLGTVYGAYETVIEDLCTYSSGGRIIRPKYIVSTATIKNAGEQTKCLYARKNIAQFPPNGFEIGDSLFIREIPVNEYPFRKYIGVSAPGQSMKTALLRIYAILLQEAYVLSKNEDYSNFIDPYYTLVGYYNSIRELGGAVRLLQDDIPARIKQIQNRYGMDKMRYLNNRIEITSRMASYDIPNKLKQLETPYGSRGCLDTAVATNMIGVGMDVDRLGLMVVTGQPKQNSEYIQATSRIGRAFPGLVVTLYNPYRPRDLSHYENFTGYHSQMYRFVEGTTATPFASRARDRVLHALIITAIRLRYPEMAPKKAAAMINDLGTDKIQAVKDMILNRMNIVKPEAKRDTEADIDTFISHWKDMTTYMGKPLWYNTRKTDCNSLMRDYSGDDNTKEKGTLRSMRDVEKAANMCYYNYSGEDQNARI